MHENSKPLILRRGFLARLLTFKRGLVSDSLLVSLPLSEQFVLCMQVQQLVAGQACQRSLGIIKSSGSCIVCCTTD